MASKRGAVVASAKTNLHALWCDTYCVGLTSVLRWLVARPLPLPVMISALPLTRRNA